MIRTMAIYSYYCETVLSGLATIGAVQFKRAHFFILLFIVRLASVRPFFLIFLLFGATNKRSESIRITDRVTYSLTTLVGTRVPGP